MAPTAIEKICNSISNKRQIIFYFILYLILVWGYAYIRKDYLWIDGDDPNLLQQSLLITKGFIPNIDFFSGYPGLSIYIQALIVRLFGAFPISQHIYTAILATFLGVAYFWAGKNTSPAVIFLLLVFSYSQGILLNPTPNPGYLFEIAFVIGLKKTFDYTISHKAFDAAITGLCFAIAFLAKQYGIFGPIIFLLSTVALLDINANTRKLIFSIFIVFIISAVLYSYFGNLVLNSSYNNTGELISAGAQFNLIMKNAFFFALPVTFGMILFIAISNKLQVNSVPLPSVVHSNLLLLSTFLGTIFLYLTLIYGIQNTPRVLQEIMILAPTRINSYLIELSLSKASIARATIGLIITFIILKIIHIAPHKGITLLFTAASIMIGALTIRGANLSATPYLPFAYSAVIIFLYFRAKKFDNPSILIVAIATAPLCLILIPYPNFAYHIPLLCFILLLSGSYIYKTPGEQGSCTRVRHPPLSIAFTLVAAALLKASIDVGSYSTYTFAGTKFVSSDPRWQSALNEAKAVLAGQGNCSTYGCRYLLLAQPGFTNYAAVIEKTIHP